MKFPNIPFLPTAPPTRSKSRRREYEYHTSGEEEEDDWGQGLVLGSGGGLAAAGFYGERSGPARNLRNGSSSASGVGSSESDVSSYTASELARDQRHRNRELRSKVWQLSLASLTLHILLQELAGSTRSRAPGHGVSARSAGERGEASDQSRNALEGKLKQIREASSNFDEVRKDLRKYKIPKNVKATDSSDTREAPSESVVVVDNNPVGSSQSRHLSASIVPLERYPKKGDKPKGARNSILNSMQVKSRADLHKLNCVDLHKIEAEAELEEDEDDLKVVKGKHKSSALKAFHANQKAIHESIVNKASRIPSPSKESN